jgi:hypothetical protein
MLAQTQTSKDAPLTPSFHIHCCSLSWLSRSYQLLCFVFCCFKECGGNCAVAASMYAILFQWSGLLCIRRTKKNGSSHVILYKRTRLQLTWMIVAQRVRRHKRPIAYLFIRSSMYCICCFETYRCAMGCWCANKSNRSTHCSSTGDGDHVGSSRSALRSRRRFAGFVG